MTPESKEFCRLRRDLEDQERFKSDSSKYKRRYVPTPQVKEIDPRERD